MIIIWYSIFMIIIWCKPYDSHVRHICLCILWFITGNLLMNTFLSYIIYKSKHSLHSCIIYVFIFILIYRSGMRFANGCTLFCYKDSPYSQFYPCNFKVDKKWFNSAEQFFQYQKASKYINSFLNMCCSQLLYQIFGCVVGNKSENVPWGDGLSCLALNVICQCTNWKWKGNFYFDGIKNSYIE